VTATTPVVVMSIGHSTRPIQELIGLLGAHHVVQLADIRTIPRSRRHPHFSAESLAVTLRSAGIAYRHMGELGGLRTPRPDSANTAWTHPSFRGYADYMESGRFETALDDLLRFAAAAPTAMMCAEARWWQCHRRLVADALLARGVEVRHIVGAAAPQPHELTPFARVVGGRVSYPGLC
jgi:uncharacterized protein (DUF488 family)